MAQIFISDNREYCKKLRDLYDYPILHVPPQEDSFHQAILWILCKRDSHQVSQDKGGAIIYAEESDTAPKLSEDEMKLIVSIEKSLALDSDKENEIILIKNEADFRRVVWDE